MTDTAIITPKIIEPGVYVGMPEDEYHHGNFALGSSGIKQLIKNPAKYWATSPYNPEFKAEVADTIAKKFGRAYHKMMLEPEKFDEAFSVKKGVATTKEDGKLGEKEYDTLLAMRKMLVLQKKQFALMTGGVAEVSVFFNYEFIGKKILCRVRFDLFAPHWVADLKTSEDISDRGLFYKFGDYGYDVSGAMYSLACKALKEMIKAGYKMPPEFTPEFIEAFISHERQLFAFIFQEKDAPHLTRGWMMTQWISEVGRDKFHYGLTRFLENVEKSGMWESPHAELEDITEDMVSDRIKQY